MRSGAAWHDACILNVSSRGMLLQAADPPLRGSYLEIRRGALVIVAEVMWAKSHRFGVKTQDVLPVDAIVDNVAAPEVGEGIKVGDRRRPDRPTLQAHQHSRHQARLIEYGFAGALALAVAGFAASEVYSVLARPAASVTVALSGGAATTH